MVDRPSQISMEVARPSGGIFAPTLRHHDGRFWLVTTNMSDPRGGQMLFTAEDPSGPLRDPIWIPVGGIDPDIAWDRDGRSLLTRAGFIDNGPQGIVQCVIDPATGDVLSPNLELWQGTGGKFPEGPHLYQIDAWWYQLIAKGGTERGHAVTVARGLPERSFPALASRPATDRSW